jgi:hypothetical protein
MQPYFDSHTVTSRVLTLIDELDAGIDPDFDIARDDLEREFAELRLQFPTYH